MRLGRSKLLPYTMYMLQGGLTLKPSEERVHTEGEGEDGKVWR